MIIVYFIVSSSYIYNQIPKRTITERMEHLLFVKSDKVVLNVLGYSSNIGYDINFTEKVIYVKN